VKPAAVSTLEGSNGLVSESVIGLPALTDAGASKAAVGTTLFTVSWKVVDDGVVPSFAVIVTVWL
jgi:hypothetical protein